MKVLLTLMALAVVGLLAGCGGGSAGTSSVGASPADVASAAGATNCDNSGYYLIIKTTGEHETIYDCAFSTSTSLPHAKCVTYQDGVANDSTAAVRLAFSSVLNGTKPSCLEG